MHHAPRSRRTRLVAIGALALTAALVTGCGGSEDSDEDKDSAGDEGSTSEVLTEEQLAEATFSIDNLPDGWTETEPDDDDEPTGTCWDQLTMDELEPDAELERSFAYGDSLPQIDAGVASFSDEEALADQFDRFQEFAAGCTTASYTDDDGVSYDLTLSMTEATPPEGADEQLDLTVAGSLSTADGQTADFVVWGSLVRIGNTGLDFGYTDFSDTSELRSTYLPIAVDRLQAVLAGETPAETVAPAPA